MQGALPVQARVTSKQYPDGSTVIYRYEDRYLSWQLAEGPAGKSKDCVSLSKG